MKPRPGDLAFSPCEIAAFNRYAEKWRGIGQRYGFDFGPDGSKLVAGAVLVLRAMLRPDAPAPPRPRPRPAFSTAFSKVRH
jgi:hypothetical protein